MHKSVALFVYEGRRDKFASTRRIFDRMCALGKWGGAVYLCAEATYEQAERFLVTGAHLNYVVPPVSHILICTWDGFIVNPARWTDDWLQYDVIGAPWPPLTQPHHMDWSWHNNHRVGNLGFCLLSRKFLELANSHKQQYHGEPGDCYLCCTQHDFFVKTGNIRYADVNTAAAFAWDWECPEHAGAPQHAFGFHGWFEGKNEQEYHDRYINS